MTGVIVRSTANVESGAKTRLSAVLHGAWILGLVVAFPQVLRLIPVSSLAAVLVFTGYKLVNPARIKELKRYGTGEMATYFLTLGAIVSTDLLTGVLLGLGVAVARLLIKLSALDIEVVHEPGSRVTRLHLKGAATFLRLSDLSDVLNTIPADRQLHVHFDRLDTMDHSILDLLQAWETTHRNKGGDVIIDWAELDRRYHSGPQVRPQEAPVALAPVTAGQ